MKFAVPLFLAAGASLLACGDNAADPTPDAGPTPDAADGCDALALGARDLHVNLFGQVLGVRYEVETPLGGDAPDSLLVELYDSTTEGLPPLATGTFELGAGVNADLATCQHCLWIPVDWDGQSPLGRVMFATAGSITLAEIDDPLDLTFAGALSGVVLREADVDPETGATSIVAGGRCVRLPDTTIDTRPTPGQACRSAEDCGNPLLEVCSPATGTCTAPECDDFTACGEDRPVCLTQYGDQIMGACYAACDPAASGGCAAGQVCLQVGYAPDFGVCMTEGDGALGAACEYEDTSSSCEAGSRCSVASDVCTRTCRYFDAEPGCQAGAQCTLFGVCEPPSHGSAAALGGTCEEGSELGRGCAADGDAFRGLCFGYDPAAPYRCEEACLGDLGCEPEEFCALRFAGGLGICLPDPVCGDGALGEIDETCDDGNTMSGDGCSGDCQTVEYAAICAAAPALAPDGMASGTTADPWDGFQATCQLGIARADVYRFTPPGRGRLRLTVDSATQHVMSVRTACADAGTEVGCASGDNDQTRELVHQVTDPAALSVIVSAFTVLEQGPYTVHAEWTDESCGDGVVAGLEVCDDGNTGSNDGCRGDCRAIEYGVYCAAATALTDGVPVAGDLAGAPNVYAASCANDVFGSGPERLYRFTAPAAGTLRVSISGETDFITFSILDGCGAPGSFMELACTSTFLSSPLEIPVTANQTVTVLVEGFSEWKTSTYTVTADLL